MTGAAHMLDQSGDALELRLRVIRQADDFPALSKLFTETMAASTDGDATSQRLANLVLRDYSLTIKVIRTANTIHYNRTGKPIRSATHAMLLLGSRTVRDLATSLILFEHYQRKSPGLKELMLLSMLTATHSRELAARLGLPEPEEAHLCGMFRNLGEVLVAAHFPDDYATILKRLRESRAADGPNADRSPESVMESAAVGVLGFTYEELGTAVARHWGMPESVTDAMRTHTTPANRSLAAIVAFSHELTSAIYRDDVVKGQLRVADAARRHCANLGLPTESIGEVLERAVAETKEVFSNARVSFDDLRLRKQTANALRTLGGVLADGADGHAPADATEDLAELRQRLIQEVETALAPERAYGLEAVLLVLLEALLRGGTFDRVVFALANAERTMIEGRIGLGDGADQLVKKLRISTKSAPVSLALDWRRVAIRTAERALTGDELKWCASVGATAFSVAPLTIDGKLVGCLYADCTSANELGDDTAAFVETVAALASRAIASRRSGPSGKSATDRASAVLRLLRGEPAGAVAADCGVTEAEVEEWKRAFLDGAMKGLGG